MTATLRPDLPEAVRMRLRSSVRPREPCGVPLVGAPTGKQSAFLSLSAPEALYGGSGGGGKSWSLLRAAAQYACVPGYAALLMRRTYPQLAAEEGLIDQAYEMFAPAKIAGLADYAVTERRWSFASGATISFRHAERDQTKHDFGSSVYQYVAFDELTTWPTDKLYRFIGFSRRRRPQGEDLPRCPDCGLSAADVPLRTRAGTNPGGPGMSWVKTRFGIKGLGTSERATKRVFIPARLEDNPHVDPASYIEGLAELSVVDRARILHGDWDIVEEGLMFQRRWFDIVEGHEVPPKLRLLRFWDLAATEVKKGKEGNSDPDWTAGALVGAAPNGEWYILDVRRRRQTPAKIEAWIDATWIEDVELHDATAVRVEQEGGSQGKYAMESWARTFMVGRDFDYRHPKGSKAERAKPVSVAAERGRVHLVRGPWIEDFLDEAEAFPGQAHDDQIDAVSGAVAELTRTKARVSLSSAAGQRLG